MEWRCPASPKAAHFNLVRRWGWMCGGICDHLVMKKVTWTLIPAFPPWPLGLSWEHWQLWQGAAEGLPLQAHVLGCLEEELGLHRNTLMVWLAPTWAQRPHCFHSLCRAWNLATQFYDNPGGPQLAAVEMTTAEPSVTTPLGANPVKKENGQARVGTHAGNQLPLDFKCSWRRYCPGSQGQQECQGEERMWLTALKVAQR